MANIVYLDRPRTMNGKVAHLSETKEGVRAEAVKLETRAKDNLAAARASTTHRKIKGPSHRTKITLTRADGQYGFVDFFVNLEAPNPWAIEFGHYPSGFFNPAKYGRVTKAPHGLYILSSAAGYGGQTSVSSGFTRGKV